MHMHPAKMAAWIKALFGVETPGGSRNIVLDMGPNLPYGFSVTFTQLLWPLSYISIVIWVKYFTTFGI